VSVLELIAKDGEARRFAYAVISLLALGWALPNLIDALALFR
jgi:hypothetical protein